MAFAERLKETVSGLKSNKQKKPSDCINVLVFSIMSLLISFGKVYDSLLMLTASAAVGQPVM